MEFRDVARAVLVAMATASLVASPTGASSRLELGAFSGAGAPSVDVPLASVPRLLNLVPGADNSAIRGMSRDGHHFLISVGSPFDVGGYGRGDVYDVSANRARLLANASALRFRAASPDFGTVVVTTDTSLVPEDKDDRRDLYALTRTGPRLIDPDPLALDGALEGAGQGLDSYVDVSVDGSTVIFQSGLPIDGSDVDARPDLYRWSALTNAVSLLTPGTLGEVSYLGASPDLTRVFFTCPDDLTGTFGGQEGVPQILERVGSEYVLRGDGSFKGLSEDGTRLYFGSGRQYDPVDTDSTWDAYGYSLTDGTWELLTPGTTTSSDIGMLDQPEPDGRRPQVSPDGSKWLVYTSDRLVPADINDEGDVYLYERGQDPVMIPHTTGRSVTASADMSTVLIATDESLIASDLNGTTDIYRMVIGGDAQPDLIGAESTFGFPATATISPDGRDVVLWTFERLAAEDTSPHASPYLWRDGAATLLVPGAAEVASRGVSRDADVIAFETADALSVDDANASWDGYAVFTDATAPVLNVDAPLATNQRSVTVRLSSAGGDALRFACRLDASAWADCPPIVEYSDQAVGTHSFQARGWDAAGNASAIATRTWVVDRAAPMAGTPRAWLASGAQGVGSGLAVRFGWSASDSGGSGLAPARLYLSTDGGALRFVGSASGSRSGTLNLEAGHRYALRVRTVDRAGNRSALSPSTRFDLLSASEASTAIAYAPGWRRVTSPAFRGGAAKTSDNLGASATYTFTGRAVTWITYLGPTRGAARVFVDGVRQTTVSLHSAVARSRVQAFGWRGTSGRHVLRIVIASDGHRVDVDGFAVIR